MGSRAAMPHCDSSILHSPGECTYCDEYPDWQEYRKLARIAFTGDPLSVGLSPCPSTWHRDPNTRDRWFGNAPIIREEHEGPPPLREVCLPHSLVWLRCDCFCTCNTPLGRIHFNDCRYWSGQRVEKKDMIRRDL